MGAESFLGNYVPTCNRDFIKWYQTQEIPGCDTFGYCDSVFLG